MSIPVFIGYDERESAAWNVCAATLGAHGVAREDLHRLGEPMLRAAGLLTRPQIPAVIDGETFDLLSGAPQATDFAFARFFIPILCRHRGTALFCDSDFMFRAPLAELEALFDPRYAVQVVKHRHNPPEADKMEGKTQTRYARKNWSSLIVWHCGHPAHRALTLDVLNAWPGRCLHGFEWLDDGDIGGLPEEWNWLEGWSDPSLAPKAVHYTRGVPDHGDQPERPYADEWFALGG